MLLTGGWGGQYLYLSSIAVNAGVLSRSSRVVYPLCCSRLLTDQTEQLLLLLFFLLAKDAY